MPSLKDHMLSRLLKLDFDGDERVFTPEQRNELCLLNVDRIVGSKILCINYTSYDICRGYDTLWPDRQSFLTTLSREEDSYRHPFWYCQLIKDFHVKVHFYPGGISHLQEKLDILWVRWVGMGPDHQWGFRRCALPKVGFVPEDVDSPVFGFLDPSLVIRGCHLIPAFIDGLTVAQKTVWMFGCFSLKSITPHTS
jgi:hypothetical protein